MKSQIKAQEIHLEEEKSVKPTNDKKSGKPKEKEKSSNSKPPLRQTPLTLLMQALSLSLLDIIYHVSPLNHSVSKRVLSTLCTFFPSLAMNSSNTNRKKHEILCIRSKLGCFTDYTNKYFSNCTQQDAKILQK
jgi:hypothetical protein